MLKNKIIVVNIFAIMFQSSFAYTIGEVYKNTAESKNILMLYPDHSPLSLTLDKNKIITGIKYTGVDNINLKEALGKYYESYQDAWKQRPNKYNHSYSNVLTKNVEVTSFGYSSGKKTTDIKLIEK